jgi:hypothetical protein
VEAQCGGIAAPRPRVGLVANSGHDGIQGDVAELREKMLVGFDEDGRVALLEEVAAEPVTAVKPLRVCGVKALHPQREVRVGRLEQKVVVRRH